MSAKRPVGRPLTSDAPLIFRMHTFFTVADAERIKAVATAEGTSAGAWVRRAVLTALAGTELPE